MTKYYTVATQHFALTMPDNTTEWSLLTNYAPFETSPKEDVLFHVTVHPEAAPLYQPSLAKHILTDQSDDDMPRIELYEQGDKMVLRVSKLKNSPICTEILAEKDYSRAEVVIFEAAGRFPIDNALMLLYAFRTATKHTLEMHASVIKRNGKGYLFLGRSGTGKSTHSRQWLSAFSDAQLLNDDNPIVYNGNVYGSPWSGKTACYNNDQAPIAGIVLLRQAPKNEMRRLSLPEAYAAIYSSSSGLRCNPAMAEGLHNTVAQLATSVPTYLLDCLPNVEAAQLCQETIG